MTVFEFDSAYTADDLEVKLSRATPDTVGVYAQNPTADEIVLAGLHPSDFAVFGYLLKDDGPRLTSYLVTDYSKRRIATAINSDIMEIFPEKYMTPRLETLIRRVGRAELAQFNLNIVADYVFASDKNS